MKALLIKYPLASFTAMAFAISWVMWLPVIFSGPEALFWVTFFFILGGMGPFAASLVIIFLSGDQQQSQTFKQRLFLWRVPARWYAVVLLLPIAIVAASCSLLLLLGEGFEISADLPPVWVYPFILLYMGFLGGGLEEPGWRGFALPRLLARYSPAASGLILGVIWAFWHLPLFLAPSLAQKDIPVGLFILTGVALSIIFTWAYLATGGSIPMAIILHAGINAALNWYPMSAETMELFLPVTLVAMLASVLFVLFSGQFRKGLPGGQGQTPGNP